VSVSASGATPTIAPTVPTGPAITPSVAPRAALEASYRAVKDPVLGYSVKVTIKNPNPTDVRGWLVTFRLSGLKLLVSNLKGANLEVRGDATYVFTPTAATQTVPAGGSVSFTFSVTGLSAVTSCTIDGQSCSG
jgi:endoglucanase